MRILCKILGHRWIPIDNPIGAVYKDFIYYERKITCERCGDFYRQSYLKQKEVSK